MKAIGRRTVVALAVSVLDVDEVELAGAEPLDADIGIGIGDPPPVDRIGGWIGGVVGGGLEAFSYSTLAAPAN